MGAAPGEVQRQLQKGQKVGPSVDHAPCYRKSKHCIRQLSAEGETEHARPCTFPLLFLGTGLPTDYHTLYCSRSGHKIHSMEGRESCIYFSGRKCLAHSASVFTERRMNLWGRTHTPAVREASGISSDSASGLLVCLFT